MISLIYYEWFLLAIDKDFQNKLEKTFCYWSMDSEITGPLVSQASETRGFRTDRPGLVSSS